jgi:hypothetical protein
MLLDWAKVMGGTSADKSQSITVDNIGNVYITGKYQGICDFDPGFGVHSLTSFDMDDIFIAKYNMNGSFKWVRGFEGYDSDYGLSIKVDDNGNVISTGYYAIAIDADPGAPVYNLASGGHLYISKLDSNGNFVFAKKIGTATGYAVSYALDLDEQGNIYTTGYFEGTADFDPNAGSYSMTPVGGDDAFISKLDNNGNYLWAGKMGGTNNEYSYAIAVDSLNNIYTTGSFKGTVDFNPYAGVTNLTSNGTSYGDAYISKITPAPVSVWAKQFGNTNNEEGLSIVVDHFGNIFTLGRFKGTVDFDPGAGTTNLVSSGGYDIYIQKLDGLGNFLWAKSYGGTSDDVAGGIAVDLAGNLYLTGNFNATMDFNFDVGVYNLTAAGALDAFVLKLNPSGGFIEVKQIGGSGTEYGYSIVVDDDNNVLVTGAFTGIADLDPGPANLPFVAAGNYDIFIIKLFQCSNADFSINALACDDYLSPSGNYTWTSSGTYFDTIPNPIGCDSLNHVAMVHLIVKNSSSPSSIDTIECDSFILNSQTFTTSGVFFPGLQNEAGCDSNVTLNLTLNYSNSIFINEAVCNSYTLNSQTYTSTGNYIQMFTNSVGCDSTIHLNLTVDGNATINQSGNTFTASLADTYQWINCSAGNTVIPGANNQTYTPTTSGSYAVITTENACIDTSECSSFVSIGLENNDLSNISVYPNPTSGNITIDMGYEADVVTIELLDVLGQKISSKKIGTTEFINIEMPQKNGIYFLEIHSDKGRFTVKVIKK